MTPVLAVIVCSTRPGRVGAAVGRWFADYAAVHTDLAVKLLDLADFGLPIYDEPHHPRLRKYEQEHTRRWSSAVEAADAYVFVLPEYNTGPCSAFVNAMHFLYHEWAQKPCGFVSYGGISGGLRSVQVAKQLVNSLKMMSLIDGVPIPFVAEKVDKAADRFTSNPLIDASADKMLPELVRWTHGLKAMREQSQQAKS